MHQLQDLRYNVVSCLFKYCLYPLEACTFLLFTSYLMTAFKIGDKLKQLEVDLLLENDDESQQNHIKY